MPSVMGNERRQTHIQESRVGHRPWALMEMLLQAARKLNVDLGGMFATLGRGISLGEQSQATVLLEEEAMD